VTGSGDRPYRILHVLPDLAIGGGQTVVLEIVRNIDRTRFEPHVAVLGPANDLDRAYREAGANPVRVTDRLAPLGLAHLIRRDGIDLVHVHSDPDRKWGQLAAYLTRTPVVGHLHSLWVHLDRGAPDESRGWRRTRHLVLGRIRDGIERATVRHYVAASDTAADAFSEHAGVPVVTYRPGLDLTRFTGRAPDATRVAARAALGVDVDALVLVSVGRFVRGKGQARLLPVLAGVLSTRPDAVLVFVGDGPTRVAVAAEAERLGVAASVRFTGTRTDVPAVLGAADVFVFASESESFGIAVLEAMAMALPVVAYRLAPLEEFVVDGESGVLVEPDAVAEFAAAALKLADDPDGARAMGRDGRVLVERGFDATRSVVALEAIYLHALKGRTPRSAT
jgi:glycosyltransferase involved in cell wall biosynthesis